MTSAQYRRGMALVASGLSTAGYVTVSATMGLENTLDHTEECAGPDFGRARGHDPGTYYVRIFGTPGERMWGWRFNHAHSVWRDPQGDFGADVLAAHRVADPH